ncbi:MAG: class I SAM-dependent methyltransferase [Rhodospirillales bacterium]|nr:class I SAM-dependent methyltransferase [Rhodospirillales bacterium]
MPSVHDLYARAASTPSDIWEHVPTLLRFGRMCDHITEFGMRLGVSTAAFLRSEPYELVSYDLDPKPHIIEQIRQAARMHGKTIFRFVEGDTRQVEVPPTDLLFIDTLHTYEQLALELRRHADKARRFIILHDTTAYADRGEVAGSRGIWPAIDEYFSPRPHWRLVERWTNNNGLAIFFRKQP